MEKLRRDAKSEIGCVGNALMKISRGSSPALRMMHSQRISFVDQDEEPLADCRPFAGSIRLILGLSM
jgi:hypothetical protein